MNLSELRNDLGSSVNQTDGTGAFVSGYITTDEADRWINQAFEDLYKWYALANKSRFESKATADTVEDQAVYTFGGDAEDMLALSSVGIKYLSTDDYFTKAYPDRENDFYQYGSEEAPQGAPIYFERQIYDTDSGHYVLAIEFPADCIPDVSVTDGLQIGYIARPPLMSGETDIPEKLPQELHKYITIGAGVPAMRKMGNMDTADSLEQTLNGKIKSFFAQEQSLTATGVKRIKRSRASIDKFYLRRR